MKKLRKLIRTSAEIQWTSIDVSQDNVQDKFSEIWTDLRKVLKGVVDLRMTGKKSDKKIKKLIKLGDMIYEGDFERFPEFTAKLRKRWSPIRGIISMSILIADLVDRENSDKAVKVMSRFIEIGDWMTGS